MTGVDLQSILKDTNSARQATFALLVLGVVDSISTGVLSTGDAVRNFFTADNCLFVKRRLKSRIADEIMGRGVQLTDLFDALPPDEAARELRQELQTIHDLSRALLRRTPLAAKISASPDT
jgi:hypothetical protein